jgi:hypothetical protein
MPPPALQLATFAWDPAAVARRALGFAGSGWTVLARGGALAVVRDRPGAIGRDQLVALGAVLELLSIAALTHGLSVEIDPSRLDERGLVARLDGSSPREIGDLRLAACVDRVGLLEAAPGGGVLAGHVRGRLAAAALHHGAELVWLEPQASDLAAAALIRIESAGVAEVVAGGRAAQRVWLEATSLGIAADPVLPPRVPVGRDVVWFGLAPAAAWIQPARE